MLEADTAPDLLLLVVPVRPVVVTFPLTALLEVSQHHDHRDSILYDHLPEILEGERLWGDGGYELLLDIVKFDRRGIDVIDWWVSLKICDLNRQ